MRLSSTQKAYIAGFLDGDGSVYVRAKPNTTYRFGYQIAPSIILFQSEKSAKYLQDLHTILGLGYIRERNDGMLELTVNKVDDIRSFIRIVKPFSLFKREQLELLEHIIDTKQKVENEEDFAALLALVDTFRKLNYSKKRKVRVPVETKRGISRTDKDIVRSLQ